VFSVKNVIIRVPATTANLGPGFDCLGMALDIWNEIHFHLGEAPAVNVMGYGAGELVPTWITWFIKLQHAI
jgi:homoserine kinase